MCGSGVRHGSLVFLPRGLSQAAGKVLARAAVISRLALGRIGFPDHSRGYGQVLRVFLSGDKRHQLLATRSCASVQQADREDRERANGSHHLYNLISEVSSVIVAVYYLLEGTGPTHTQWEGMTQECEHQALMVSRHPIGNNTFPCPVCALDTHSLSSHRIPLPG